MWGDFVDDFRRAPIPEAWKKDAELRGVYYDALDAASEPFKVRTREAGAQEVPRSVGQVPVLRRVLPQLRGVAREELQGRIPRRRRASRSAHALEQRSRREGAAGARGRRVLPLRFDGARTKATVTQARAARRSTAGLPLASPSTWPPPSTVGECRRGAGSGWAHSRSRSLSAARRVAARHSLITVSALALPPHHRRAPWKAGASMLPSSSSRSMASAGKRSSTAPIERHFRSPYVGSAISPTCTGWGPSAAHSSAHRVMEDRRIGPELRSRSPATPSSSAMPVRWVSALTSPHGPPDAILFSRGAGHGPPKVAASPRRIGLISLRRRRRGVLALVRSTR